MKEVVDKIKVTLKSSKKKFGIIKFYIFLVIPRSWGVHRYPWFQNQSINVARAEVHNMEDIRCALLYR